MSLPTHRARAGLLRTAGLLATLLLTGPSASAATPEARPPVDLVVLLVVDQLRPDLVGRYEAHLTGGLRRLWREGLVYQEGRQDHAITQTAPGHATLLSGRVPARTNIVANAYGVDDGVTPIIDAPNAVRSSPRRFRGTALYDWMLARNPGTRVLSVSRKNRGAILPVGRARGDVYWYAPDIGGFSTSRWYRDTLPAWVRAWNARGGFDRLAGTTWTLLLPDSAYRRPDWAAWENAGRDAVFPHHLPTTRDSIRDQVTYYPWTDSLTLDFALEGMRHTGVGRRPGRPDLLVVSLSTTDAVGHQWGPDSRESQDQILRLDRWLGRFLDSLGTMVPEARTLVVLSSDHGVQSAPAFQREVLRRPARNVWLGGLERTARAALARWRGDFGVDFDDGLLMADTVALRARGVDVDSLAEALAAPIRGEPGVRHVYTPRLLAAAPASDEDAGRWRRTIPPDLGWLLAAVPAPNTLWSREAEANHGTMNVDDMRVPIVFRGPGIAAGTIRRPVRTVDIAPTLAALLGVRPAEPLDGRPLPEVLR